MRKITTHKYFDFYIKKVIQRTYLISFTVQSGGGGGYSREFWVGVCREGSLTLTLFKD